MPTTTWVNHYNAIIRTDGLFSFQANLAYLNRSTNECMFHIEEGSVIRAIEVEGQTYLISISSENDSDLCIRFLQQAPMDQAIRYKIITYVCDWFDLYTDLDAFYTMAATDPLLHQPVSTFYGLRVIGIPDLYEALVWGILGQQINLSYAYTLKRRFVEQFGNSIDSDGTTFWLFPKPDIVASSSIEELMNLGMTKRKAEYLLSVSQLLKDGTLSKANLATDLKTAEKQLTSIRGIGPWTANYVLMRCLRFPNAFPIDDVGLHNAIKFICGIERKPTKTEIREMAMLWKGFESYATFYLWRMLY
ncbi:DNA-3-methyladenine glycosylase [Bacillus sp. JCM 19041]|uniref:DNA-3-methyladenine glycosylase family protein n=1 Tax=Bacillus sp. JCM 19041 TaxID=1460637 RepID=UPI0006D05CD4